jgi:transposase InsO family protein
VISAAGLSTDPAKVRVVTEWPVPANLRELRGFLGLAGYYRKFVRHFGIIAKPLTELLKKDQVFVWTTAHNDAFSLLKSALSSAPVLALPDFSRPFHIETNASGFGIGVVLQQDNHHIAFISKSLSKCNQGLTVYEKEYLAILLAVDTWRHYLLQAEFFIHTDHQSLTHLNEQRLHTAWQQKVFARLMGLQYKILYKKGVENGAADALSRRRHPEQLLAISSVKHQWLEAVVLSYQNHSEALKLLAQLATQPGAHPHYSLVQGIIRYKGRVWLESSKAIQQQVLSAFHASPVGGHSGAPATYSRLKQLFFWHGMKADVWRMVQSCSVCLQAKPDHARYPGLLQPLPVPSASWEIISMDFVEGLPTSGSANAILVVVDKFSKFAHFIALKHPFTAQTVAQLFLDNIYCLHGLPKSIISDRDKIFTSQFWQSLFKAAGTNLCLSSSYHPQSDGQTERVNQCLETFLRCFVHSCPSQWRRWLSLAEYWYNTSLHSALGRSPFEVLCGCSPRHMGLDVESTAPVSDLQSWLSQRAHMQELIHQHLLRAQDRMKRQADKGRSEREFAVGDNVFLKLQPYVQSSLARRANHKLSFRFFGPYKVIQKIGSVAYKLELPSSFSIHPVFHVSQLKLSPGVSLCPLPYRLTCKCSRYLFAFCSGAGLLVIIHWSRVSSSGHIHLLNWRLGSHSSLFVSSFHMRRPGVMPALKARGMLAVLHYIDTCRRRTGAKPTASSTCPVKAQEGQEAQLAVCRPKLDQVGREYK